MILNTLKRFMFLFIAVFSLPLIFAFESSSSPSLPHAINNAYAGINGFWWFLLGALDLVLKILIKLSAAMLCVTSLVRVYAPKLSFKQALDAISPEPEKKSV